MPGLYGETPTLAELQGLPQIDRDILFSQMGLNQEQGNQDEMLSQLAQQVAQAQQGVQSAQQDYSNLAAMPPPSSGAPETIRNLFANIASGVTGNPVYSQQAGEINKQNLSSAVEFRKAQLDTLHDALLRRATLAQSLGNLEVSTKATMQAGRVAGERHKLDKLEEDKRQFAQDRVMRDLESKNRMAEIAAQGAQARQTKEVVGGEVLSPADYANDLHVEDDGRKWMDATLYKGKDLNGLRKFATSQGARVLGANDVSQLQDINSSLENINRMNESLKGKLAEKWYDPKRLTNVISSMVGSDKELAAYAAFFPTRIRALRAEAGSKSFRMTNAEINRMEHNSPGLSNTLEVFLARGDIWRGTLNNVKDRILGETPKANRPRYVEGQGWVTP